MILEKKEGEPFLPEDYDRLDEILKDKSSPYKGLSYYEITHKKVHGEGEVDAVSSATTVIIDESKTVLGAAWTCYTLWHWANGEVIQEIQRITGAATNTNELLIHLDSKDDYRRLFALNELIRRRDCSDLVVSEILEKTSLKDNNPLFFKKALTYLEQAESVTYYQAIKQLMEVSSKKKRITLWNSILKYGAAPPVEYFDSFWEKLLESKDYHEINLFLTILEQKDVSNSTLIEKMIPLLEEDYSILNRRIYWFLSEQILSDSQKKILKSYYDLYSEYL